MSTIGNDFYSDNTSSIFVIGSIKNSGFYGFLYSLEIYNQYLLLGSFSTVCNGCLNCLTTGVCLGNCNLTQINSSNVCTNCLESCSYGCVRSTDCNLCADSLCGVCNNFTAVCSQCYSNAYLNTTAVGLGITKCCGSCDSTCLTCTGPSYNQCSSCKPSLVYFSYYFQCLPISICSTLPGVPAYNATQCKTSNGLVFSTKFTSFQTPFYDTISNISISTQPNSTFYPNYGKNDPVIAAGRGYYFNQTSYLLIDSQTTSKLVIGPEFDLGF